jgi:hypothetical protein
MAIAAHTLQLTTAVAMFERSCSQPQGEPEMTVKQQDLDELEAIVDRIGLPTVLAALGELCYLKGEHIRTNWQDSRGATQWERMARPINAACDRARDAGL